MEFFDPYVQFNSTDMILRVEAVDCTKSFNQLPFVVDYSDVRGKVSTSLFTISVNPTGC